MDKFLAASPALTDNRSIWALFGTAATVVFRVIAQIGEQVDFLPISAGTR